MKLHGARPWHPSVFIACLYSSKREAPRDKPVASLPTVARLLWSFWGWGDGDEVFDEAMAVFGEKLVYSLKAWGADD